MNPEGGHITWLGIIIFAIVMGSLGCIILAAIFGRPWKPKVTVIVIVTLFTCLATLVAGLWVGGHIFSVLMG